jgi:ArsR family transcriptional regulator
MNTDVKLNPALFEDKARQAARHLKALSNEQRLMILCRLSGGECSVGDLREDFDLSQSAFSQHLAILRDQGLIAARREGQTVFYSICDPASLRIVETLASIYCPELF